MKEAENEIPPPPPLLSLPRLMSAGKEEKKKVGKDLGNQERNEEEQAIL